MSDGTATAAGRGRWAFLALVVIGYAVAIWLLFRVHSDQDRHWLAALLAIGGLVVITLVLHLLGAGVESLVMGKDKRISTSKLQAVLWTYALSWVLLAVVIGKWVGVDAGYEQLIAQSLPQEYLILLGGPFAAAVASKGIVATKVENGTMSKPPGDPDVSTKKKIAQVFSNDQGNTDLVDTQYLIFNLVGLAYLIGGFLSDPSGGVPSIPGIVVGLTSVSAATYVSNKAVSADAASLTSVVPPRGARGDSVRVFGRNLLLPHEDGGYHEVFVLFDKVVAELLGLRKQDGRLIEDGTHEHAPYHSGTGEDEIWVEVPDGLEGRVRVTVRNFKGLDAAGKEDFEVVAAAGRHRAQSS
jgi:hypothetical protein